VKLKEAPSLVELSKQVELVNNSFDEICHSGKNLTIRLQKVATDASPTTTTSAENNTNNIGHHSPNKKATDSHNKGVVTS
jgi:hypothetical protein